jgi:hypothetical protein
MYEKRFLCGVEGVIEAGGGRVEADGTPGGVLILEGSCIEVVKS